MSEMISRLTIESQYLNPKLPIISNHQIPITKFWILLIGVYLIIGLPARPTYARRSAGFA
jgi:hypothetical protein